MKSGVAAIIGRPNVGKSSLINALLKTQAVIVSPKPQTTRNSIRCIYNDEDAQIVFTDTPGLFKLTNSRDRLGAFLNDSVRDSLDYADAAVWLIDAGTRKLSPDDYELAQALSEAHSMPVILAANKSEKSDPAPAFKLYDKLCTFTAKLAISARLRRGLDDLLVTLKTLIPEGTPIYDPDILVDTTERFMAGEAIRGKLMMMLHDEVPHRVAVEIDEYKSPDEYPDRKKLYVRASLIVETDGQKKILIGADGSMIKRIGVASRAELEKLTGHSVYLELWVKVLENWRRNQTALKRLGYS